MWEREINELIPNLYDLTMIKQPEDLPVRRIINNAYELAEIYLDEHNISDEYVKNFIDYNEFGQYLVQQHYIWTYFESSGRIVEWA